MKMRMLVAVLLTHAVAARLPAVDPAILRMIAPDAASVAGVNVRSVKTSSAGQALLGDLQKDEKSLQELIQATGFDPRRDLEEIVFVSANPQDKRAGVALAAGVFDTARILAAARGQKAQITAYRDIDLIRLPSSQGPASFLAFPTKGIAVAGDEAGVKAALDRRAGGAPRLDPNVEARLQELSANYDIWFFGTSPVDSMLSRLPAPKLGGEHGKPAINALQAIRSASGGMKLGPKALIAGEVVTRSPEDAQAVRNIVNFLAAMAQMNPEDPKTKDLAAIAGTLDIKTKGSTVYLSLTAPESAIEQLLKPQPKQSAPRKRADL